ncbi:MAG: hypothetical protein ABI844_17050 [Saprospiraceae bacterium]
MLDFRPNKFECTVEIGSTLCRRRTITVNLKALNDWTKVGWYMEAVG